MTDRFGAIKHWSEYNSTITMVNSAKVKVFDLKLCSAPRESMPFGYLCDHGRYYHRSIPVKIMVNNKHIDIYSYTEQGAE